MSHFTVLVHIPANEVTNVNDIETLVSKKLQPFHEFECTGIKDEYVTEVDETEERMAAYNTDIIPSVFFNNTFYGTKYSQQCKKFFVMDSFMETLPVGYEFREAPASEIFTFREFLTEWEGCTLDGKYTDYRDGKFYSYTNVNSKWDWWSIGGRWSGHFCNHNGNKFDIIKVKDWDIETPKNKVIEKFSKFYDKYENSELVNLEFLNWNECTSKFGIDEARAFYHSQEYKKGLIKLFNTPEESEFSWVLHDPESFYGVSREEFYKDRYFNEIGTFAILHDGKWLERGDMGWWGCISDENDNWNDIFLDTITKFDDNDYLVLVDCHI